MPHRTVSELTPASLTDPASKSFKVGPCTLHWFKPLHSQSFAWPPRINLSSFDMRGQSQTIWEHQAFCISSLPNSFIMRTKGVRSFVLPVAVQAQQSLWMRKLSASSDARLVQ